MAGQVQIARVGEESAGRLSRQVTMLDRLSGYLDRIPDRFFYGAVRVVIAVLAAYIVYVIVRLIILLSSL